MDKKAQQALLARVLELSADETVEDFIVIAHIHTSGNCNGAVKASIETASAGMARTLLASTRARLQGEEE
jgi:hypothetical protein